MEREKRLKTHKEHSKMLPQLTTMNAIGGQAVIVIYISLIFCSLTPDNILNIVVLLILAGVSITAVFGDNGIIKQAEIAANLTKESMKNEEEDVNNLTNKLDDLLKYEVFDSSKGVNTPQLGEEMTGIKWDTSKNDWVDITGKNDPEWYNYQEKKWANAVIKDEEGNIESYWVWIPRYAYCIKSGYHSNTAGEIEIRFLKGTTNDIAYKEEDNKEEIKLAEPQASGANNWLVHPAFKNGKVNNYENGEWNKEIAGIWVAKFEASHENCTTTASTGINNTNNTTLKLKVIPGVTSWRNISIGNTFTVCKEYKPSLNSHLIKNSEWGAVAYLRKSEYGQNDTNIALNTNSSYLTGGGENNTYATTNIAQSTTGNQWGIYDMNGGAYERTASYINNNYTKNENEQYTNGQALIDEVNGWLKQVYKVGETENNQNNYEKNKGIYGDALYETSSDGDEDMSWLGGASKFPTGGNPFFTHGADKQISCEVFNFSCQRGNARHPDSFRLVLVTN